MENINLALKITDIIQIIPDLNLTREITKTIMATDDLVKKYNFTYKTQKYDIRYILDKLEIINKEGLTYKAYDKIRHESDISGRMLNYHMAYLAKYEIHKKTYINILDIYYSKSTIRCSALLYQCIDSTFVNNKYASDDVGRNYHYKNKYGYKISTITDENGITISVVVGSGNKNDIKYVEDNINNLLVNVTTTEKKYMLGDKGYDSNDNRKLLKSENYTCIIPYNKRNTKAKEKIKKLTAREKKIIKKRYAIERSYAWLKNYKRVSVIYDKNIKIFESHVYLALCSVLIKKV